MAHKNDRQPRQNGMRPLVQPALPSIAGLRKPTSSSATTSVDPTKSSPLSPYGNKAAGLSETSALSPPVEEETQKFDGTVAQEAVITPAKIPEISADHTSTGGRDEVLAEPSSEDVNIPGSSESEIFNEQQVQSSAVTHLPDDSTETRLVNGTSTNLESSSALQEDFDNPASRSSSKEVAEEPTITETKSEAQVSADISYAEVNGMDTNSADLPERILPQTDHVEQDSTRASTVDEGYASNGHGHTSFSPPQLVDPPTGTPFISLSDHLLQLSHTKAWSDCAIVINCRDNQSFLSYAHSMMLLRSPRLRKMMERQAATSQNSSLTFFTPIAILPHAFEAALRFLYSDTVLTADALTPPHVASDMQQARLAILPYILSYWTSGLLLGSDHIQLRAARLLTDFLDWDVVELLVKEAENIISGISAVALDSDIDWSGLAALWKTTAFTFCATKVDPHAVKLDTGASTLLRSRFGPLEDSRGKHNPVLASMVFGSMPSSADMSPSSPRSDAFQQVFSISDTAISNILLNADFQDLLQFQKQWKLTWGGAGQQLMHDVVTERECRRQKVVGNQAIPNKQRMANSAMWDVVGFKEIVAGGDIRRERVGYLLSSVR